MIRASILGLFWALHLPSGLRAQPAVSHVVQNLGDPRPKLSFRVRLVSGTVVTRTERSGTWAQVKKGETLYEGQLIQIMDNSTLSLRPMVAANDRRTSEERADLTFTMPLIMRLGPQMMRKVELTRYFLQDLPQASQDPGDDGGRPRFAMGEAWRKIAAVLTRASGEKRSDSESLSQLESRGFSMSVSAKQISILAPSSQAVILSRGLPASIKTVWSEAKDSDQTYKIYFWPASESRPAPVTLTSATHYQVRASKPGTFFLQIVSEDERWQSKAHAVVVSLDEEQVQPTASSRFTSGLDLTYPPDSTEVHTPNDQARVSFAWMDNRRLETDPMNLVIKTADGREVLRKVTKETHLDDVVLPVGDYEWFVETNQKGNREVRLSSAVHALKVQKSRTPLATGVVDEILKSGGSKTVYFADGL